MTGKNVLVAIGFAIITVTQLVLGMILIVYAAERGGEAKSLYRKGKLHSNWLFALMRPRSPTAPTDTPSGVPQLRICPKQTRGDCTYRHFHFFWWVGLNTNHLALMRRKYQYRLPCIFTYHVRGDAVEGTWSQGFGNFQNYCRGCDALLHDYNRLPFRG